MDCPSTSNNSMQLPSRQTLITAVDCSNMPTVTVIGSPTKKPNKKPPAKRKPGRSTLAVTRMIGLCLLLLLLICACIIIETSVSSMSARPSPGNISPHDQKYHENIVKTVNGISASRWTAKYNRFASRSSVKSHFDYDEMTIIAQQNRKMNDEALYGDTIAHLRMLMAVNIQLPGQFDARLRWPYCATVHSVPNQGGCGSCWSMAATAVMSDRICIASNGTYQPSISAQDLTSCCVPCGGCQGSHWALSAFTYWKQRGLVSGGGYGSYEGCKPYTIAPDCGSPCSVQFYDYRRTGKCEQSCQLLYVKNYDQDLHRAKSVYWLRADRGSNEIQPDVLQTIRKIVPKDQANEIMKRELLLYGPFLACFTVYEDFQHYSTGIYQPFLFYDRDSNKELYGHCAKLLGWGQENGTDYWLYMNTWGREWGEYGFFRIIMSETPEEAVGGLPV